MIKVASLHIYPIKGMQAVSVESVVALERGFEHDRRYMLVDKNGSYISQKTHSEVVFFQPEMKDEEIIVLYKGESISIPLEASLNNTVETKIFGKPVQATEVSLSANIWFSSILGEDTRLVKMTEKDIRLKQLIKGPAEIKLSFADGYPYLILGTESVNHLNSKLDTTIHSNRFRPNIILDTKVAYIEDAWEEIKIGSAKFLMIKPCSRCPVINIDQSSGIKTKDPLKTLRTYRKQKNMVNFGSYAISREESRVYIGDEVVVL